MTGGRGRPLAAVLLAAALASAFAAALAAAEPPAAPSPAAAAPADLEEAGLRLAKASSPAEYAASLGAFSSSLPPADSLALLNQSLPVVSPEFRRPLLAKAGDLALLLGLFADAGGRYEEASADASAKGGDASLLLRAARCFLAAGDPDRASSLASGLIAKAADPESAAAARLVVAWSLVLRDRYPDARAIASEAVADQASPAARRREARFILWLCASGDGAGPERKSAAAALAAEFPGSPEALIASGTAAPPPLPHWYLGGLLGSSEAPARPAAATPAPAPSNAPGAKPVSAEAKGRRLQVGYFSLEENAKALRDELGSKRFKASIEPRTRAGKTGEEKRWIVVVDAGSDLARTMQTLKDAGYESYVIE